MAQHFLLSAKARTLSLGAVFRMEEEQAHQTFKEMRWPQTNGEPVCPKCGGLDRYDITKSRRFKCKACGSLFSVTSGTIFASRKLPLVTLLAAVVMFVNGAKGVPALQLSRDLDVQYKTAFVLFHKLREAMAVEIGERKLNGVVEVDGAYFGGYVKPANKKADRVDRRLSENQNGKKQCVVLMRERRGRSNVFVCESEAEGAKLILENLAPTAVVIGDESTAWNAFYTRHETYQVKHAENYMDRGISTNQAESYFSRLRRAEVGTHHHIAGPYLLGYAREMAWREDNRRIPNGSQTVMVVEAALAAKQSRQWKGYWQRQPRG